MGTKPLINRTSIELFIDAQKATINWYATISGVVGLMAALTLGIAQIVPWSATAIFIVACLSLVCCSLLYSFYYVLIEKARIIANLETEIQELKLKIKERVDRQHFIKFQLKNEINEFLNQCEDLEQFFKFLQQDIFPFLVKEFGFVRIGFTKVASSPKTGSEFLFSHANGRVNDHEARFKRNDLFHSEDIISSDKTAELTYACRTGMLPAYFLPLRSQEDLEEWYVVSFYFQGRSQNEMIEREDEFAKLVEQEIAINLAPELRQAFKRIYDRRRLRKLEQDVKYNHLCAILLWTPNGVNLDRSLDLSKTEETRIATILDEEESKKCLEQAFYRDYSKAEEPIIVPRGSYNWFLIPVLMNRRVYRVVFFLDEAFGHKIDPHDHTRWRILFQLVNFLYRDICMDDITSLVNKWFFAHHMKHIIPASAGYRLGLFIIGLREISFSQTLSQEFHGLLRDIAQIVEKWVYDRDPRSLAARYEGGVYFLVREVDDEDSAEAQAIGLKSQLDRLLGNIKEQLSINIGVVVFECDILDPFVKTTDREK
ncbi:MAG: hypothetical protein HS114_00860 [Anaerolineales bacterium]|nr:hypothetical protein [Anaerolineales bacterium]